MRTIAEIKQEMAEAMMRDTTLASAYGYEPGSSFAAVFSRVSVENLLLYVVAVGIYTLEALLAEHRTDVDAAIDETLPHRPKWYRDRVLQFLKGRPLVEDSDRYDTSDMTDEEVEALRVVKYAAATESADASLLTVKVAGEAADGSRTPLDAETETQLLAYLGEVKDAGVRIALVNQEADQFRCTVDVWYDPMLTAQVVGDACRRAIVDYIQNLPFNGEYTHMALIDRLQAVEGVRVAELRGASVQVAGEQTLTAIDARHRPVAGHMAPASDDGITLNLKAYDGEV